MDKCKNCGHEIIETGKGIFLHADDYNIGNDQKPHPIKTCVKTCRKCGCYYPEF